MAYVWTISVAQVFWVVLAIVDLPLVTTFMIAVVLIGLEMIGPPRAAAEGRDAVARTSHRQRYGLLVIITLGGGSSARSRRSTRSHGSEGF
jgi:low temperature requirement protein LtrA